MADPQVTMGFNVKMVIHDLDTPWLRKEISIHLSNIISYDTHPLYPLLLIIKEFYI